jgi:hypothetical protein
MKGSRNRANEIYAAPPWFLMDNSAHCLFRAKRIAKAPSRARRNNSPPEEVLTKSGLVARSRPGSDFPHKDTCGEEDG